MPIDLCAVFRTSGGERGSVGGVGSVGSVGAKLRTHVQNLKPKT